MPRYIAFVAIEGSSEEDAFAALNGALSYAQATGNMPRTYQTVMVWPDNLTRHNEALGELLAENLDALDRDFIADAERLDAARVDEHPASGVPSAPIDY